MLPQVPTKPLIPAIPTDDREFRELKEDLRAMGCEGLLAKPWNVQVEDMLREFLFLRGNQWDETTKTRRDPKNWTPDTWAEVYGFKRGIKDGWAGRKNGLFAEKFKGEFDPKEGLHPANCRDLREEDVRIHDANIKSGKAQADNPRHGNHPVPGFVRSLTGKLGVNHSRHRDAGHLPDRPETLLHLPFHHAPLRIPRVHHRR